METSAIWCTCSRVTTFTNDPGRQSARAALEQQKDKSMPSGGEMASVREHYDVHLDPIYGWMLGDFDAAKEAARTELQAAGLHEGAGRTG
jgi:hypothetical protein